MFGEPSLEPPHRGGSEEDQQNTSYTESSENAFLNFIKPFSYLKVNITVHFVICLLPSTCTSPHNAHQNNESHESAKARHQAYKHARLIEWRLKYKCGKSDVRKGSIYFVTVNFPVLFYYFFFLFFFGDLSPDLRIPYGLASLFQILTELFLTVPFSPEITL